MNRLIAMKVMFLLIGAALLAGCGDAYNSSSDGDTSSSAAVIVDCVSATSAQTVIISGFKFTPSEVSVTASSVIKWTNGDSVPHSVSSGTASNPSDKFDTTMSAGESECIKFNQSGSYSYYCKYHTYMTASVTVAP